MYTTPPVTGFMVLSIVCILMLATIPLVGFTVYGEPDIAQPPADSNADGSATPG